ncbi:hypothetical protein V6N11_012388 [Hibiscus sabdariffa]|uniref:Uncharacterized protein n=1 Tax=Hibiscus sabdariffa TaxID=183260 RepID=A0ABR2QAZ2_9ROSI
MFINLKSRRCNDYLITSNHHIIALISFQIAINSSIGLGNHSSNMQNLFMQLRGHNFTSTLEPLDATTSPHIKDTKMETPQLSEGHFSLYYQAYSLYPGGTDISQLASKDQRFHIPIVEVELLVEF